MIAKARATDGLVLYGMTQTEAYRHSAPHLGEPMQRALVRLTNHAAQYDAGMVAHRTDRTLSPEGRHEKITATKRATSRKLDEFFKVEVLSLRSRAVEAEARLMALGAIPRPTDPAALAEYQSKLEEIRAQLRPLSPTEREAIYRSAKEPLILDAIESAGPVLVRPEAPRDGVSIASFAEFVPRDVIAQAVRARGVARNPVLAQTSDDLRSLADCCAHAVGLVRQVVEEDMAPDPATDPVAMAAGARR